MIDYFGASAGLDWRMCGVRVRRSCTSRYVCRLYSGRCEIVTTNTRRKNKRVAPQIMAGPEKHVAGVQIFFRRREGGAHGGRTEPSDEELAARVAGRVTRVEDPGVH